MSKLFELLNSIISKLNLSVKMESQELTDEQKSQVRKNIGAASIDDVGNGGSVEQVQTDYEQNDPSQPDHIKNRPFYNGGTVEIKQPSNVSSAIIVNSQPFEALDGMSISLIKASDNYFEMPEETYGGLIYLSSAGEVEEVTIDKNFVYSFEKGFALMLDGAIPLVVNITSTGSVTFPTSDFVGEDVVLNFIETGAYLLYVGEFACVDSYKKENIKTLDIKYLPKNMALGYEEKPFEDIIWDGNTEGVTPIGIDSVEEGMAVSFRWYHVSDTVLTKDDCLGATVGEFNNIDGGDFDNTIDDIGDMMDIGSNGSFALSMPNCLVIAQDNDNWDLSEIFGLEQTLTFPKAGVWFALAVIDGETALGMRYLLFSSNIVKIDKKFLPSTLPEVSSSDFGKFLRVDIGGNWYAASIQNAEGAEF